jgi:hypothetical protein
MPAKFRRCDYCNGPLRASYYDDQEDEVERMCDDCRFEGCLDQPRNSEVEEMEE